ncbi:MAG: flagellar M-ring protein FliF [Clostridiales bacterium]|nr:flagellar M-ring protein FliF [Clostridiales bacterium]
MDGFLSYLFWTRSMGYEVKDFNVKESADKIKQYVQKMPQKSKRTLIAAAGAVVILAVVITIILNASGGNYVELYSDLSPSESAKIYQSLLDMGADAKVGSKGSILVRKEEYDIWILRLAAEGLPKSALPYDVFSSHSGMTATESEKAQWLSYQLQDRIQATLERMDCVDSATVTITVPETSDYVWEKATETEKASAGVLLSLKRDVVISGEQVSAIRNLIAASVPKMEPEDVRVVDSSTMLELTASADDDGQSSAADLTFELMVQKQIEDNIVRLLSPRYGSNGVVAAAKVTIDYDKMMTEKYEISPNEKDDGYVSHGEGKYTINGTVPAGDVAGEENNTDIPKYGYTSPNNDKGMTDYSWSNDYDYGYIKTQIESGNAILKRATVSVLVNDPALTEPRREDLTELVSGCSDIPEDLITVSAFNMPLSDDDLQDKVKDDENPGILGLPMWVLIVAGAVLLLLIIAILVVVTIVKRKKKEKLRALAEAEEQTRLEEEKRKQEEIEKYKLSLEEIAKGKVNPKDEAILEEVRNFAKQNPQVTANLLRTWMKEE